MREMLSQQEAEEWKRRERRRDAALRYQQELDAQVRTVRQRSIDSLTSKLFPFLCA